MTGPRGAAALGLACAAAAALSGARAQDATPDPSLVPAPPTAAELEAQQPEDRSFALGEDGDDGEDIAPGTKPSVREVICRPFGPSPMRLKCRYTLTVGDWVGPGPAPKREVEDILSYGSETWSIAELDARAVSAEDRAHGAWIGPIRLCGDTVAGAIIDRDIDGMAILSLTFRPDSAPLLGRETLRRLNARLPVILDGRSVSEPMVMEPILGGQIQLRGPDAPELEAIRRAALGSCQL
jgi:hypothetical protein